MAFAQPPDPRPAYVVVVGDTLWHVAAVKLGDPLKWPALHQANKATVADPDLIFPGQSLVIPVDASPTGGGKHAGANGDAKPDTGSGVHAKPVGDDVATDGRPAGSGLAARVLVTLRAQVGKPYVWGADGPDSFDCSGLVQYAFGTLGIHLPRTTWAQVHAGHAVSLADLQPGDLVFYRGNGHVTIYIGNGQILEAPRPGLRVRIRPLQRNGISAIRRVL